MTEPPSRPRLLYCYLSCNPISSRVVPSAYCIREGGREGLKGENDPFAVA